MKVILLQDVEKLGEEGEIVTVKAGYGRNYLIPQGIARLATDGVVKARREEIRQQARKRAQREADAVALKKQLEGTEVVVEARVGEENRIFGTVTPQQVALKLATQGFEIGVIGIYTAHVKLHTNVVADLKVRVIPEGGVAADAEPEPEATEEAEEA